MHSINTSTCFHFHKKALRVFLMHTNSTNSTNCQSISSCYCTTNHLSWSRTLPSTFYSTAAVTSPDPPFNTQIRDTQQACKRQQFFVLHSGIYSNKIHLFLALNEMKKFIKYMVHICNMVQKCFMKLKFREIFRNVYSTQQ